MEPLVEVNTDEEMARALKLGSKVIGVNNRYTYVSHNRALSMCVRCERKVCGFTRTIATSHIHTRTFLFLPS